MNLIEQLEKLPLYQQDRYGDLEPARGDNVPHWIRWSDLDDIIEQAKTEQRRIDACLKACDGISTENLEENDPLLSVVRKYNELLKQKSTPQPDHTKLIGELVEALEKANPAVVVASDYYYDKPIMSLCNKYNEMLSDINALLTKAREAIK